LFSTSVHSASHTIFNPAPPEAGLKAGCRQNCPPHSPSGLRKPETGLTVRTMISRCARQASCVPPVGDGVRRPAFCITGVCRIRGSHFKDRYLPPCCSDRCPQSRGVPNRPSKPPHHLKSGNQRLLLIERRRRVEKATLNCTIGNRRRDRRTIDPRGVDRNLGPVGLNRLSE